MFHRSLLSVKVQPLNRCGFRISFSDVRGTTAMTTSAWGPQDRTFANFAGATRYKIPKSTWDKETKLPFSQHYTHHKTGGKIQSGSYCSCFLSYMVDVQHSSPVDLVHDACIVHHDGHRAHSLGNLVIATCEQSNNFTHKPSPQQPQNIFKIL